MGIEIRDHTVSLDAAGWLKKVTAPRYAHDLAIFNPTTEDIERLVDIASQEISSIADPAHVAALYQYNPETLWVISNTASDATATGGTEGFFSFLPLNRKGAQALAAGKFQPSRPDEKYICRQWEQPVAIYFWCIFMPGSLSGAMWWLANFFQSPKFFGLPVFAKVGTQAGARFLKRIGFKPGATWNGVRNDDYISMLPNMPARGKGSQSVTDLMPAYDNYARRYNYTPPEKELSCSVVSSIDELMQVMAIRSVAYIGEQECPYDEEWDGNDLSATHLLARIGDEPVGTIRLRPFSGVAKVERLAVLPKFRGSRTAFKLEHAVTELARAMGYQKLIGHAHANVEKFWSSRGWRPIEGRESFTFSDHQCVQMEKHVEPHKDAIGFDAPPLKLIRPAGRWHVPGPLDRSAARPPVNTAGTKTAA